MTASDMLVDALGEGLPTSLREQPDRVSIVQIEEEPTANVGPTFISHSKPQILRDREKTPKP